MIVITLLDFDLQCRCTATFVENQSKILGMMSLFQKVHYSLKVSRISMTCFRYLGFYSVNNVIYMMVLGSIFAIVLASNILLKEEYNKTAEYLLDTATYPQRDFLQQTGGNFALYIFIEPGHCPGRLYMHGTG